MPPQLEPPFGREMVFGVFHPFFVYTIIIVLVIALIFFWLVRSAGKKETALEILKKRYARGEIDRDKFNEIKKELEG